MPKSKQEKLDALTQAISRVVTPVIVCMALAIWLVNSLGDPNTCKAIEKDKPTPTPLAIAPDASGGSQSPTSSFNRTQTIAFVCSFLALVVVFTFVLVWLYKRGCTKIIQLWLVFAVFVILAYVGGIYLFEFCRSRCINLDWITLTFAVWNFTVTGLISVFYVVPRVVNQAYLIVMSALMAYIFRAFPDWATWTVLALLVLWDLFAVLAPWGPLKKLVELARERGEDIPALVYDTNPSDVGRDPQAKVAAVVPPSNKNKSNQEGDTEQGGSGSNNDAANQGDKSPDARSMNGRRKKRKGRAANGESGPHHGTTATTGRDEQEGEEVQVGTLGTHLKLGLGDFVFYSVLVAQASRDGAMTAITSFVAILTGLCATLFLVTVYRKALPALPISITAGLLFYVLTRFVIQPFVLNLMPELLFH